jgi:hypothetical protein
MARLTAAPEIRGGGGAQDFPATDQSFVDRTLTRDAISAWRAAAEVGIYTRTLIRLCAAVDVRRKQRFDVSTLSHDSYLPHSNAHLGSRMIPDQSSQRDAALAFPSARERANPS